MNAVVTPKNQGMKTLIKKSWMAIVLGLVWMTAQAAVVPKELPRPDDQPPSNKKPVKVYILSGQSNMVGFGTVSGSSPVYPSIFLSPDPSAMPCRMPVGTSALLPSISRKPRMPLKAPRSRWCRPQRVPLKP
jgi:hypothetical protein